MVILAAISAAVAPSRATSNRSLAPGGGTQAFADHDRDKSGAALLVAVAVTAFKPPGSSSWRAPPARRHGQDRRT